MQPEPEVKEVTDVIDSLKNQVEFAQDNINECQTNIVQVEEAKVRSDAENVKNVGPPPNQSDERMQ